MIEISDVATVRRETYTDDRGFFIDLGHWNGFVSHSRSQRNVLRGLHYQVQNPQGKLVSVTRGTIFDVAVDLRKSSPTFGRWVGKRLHAGIALWIPPGFAHGFLALTDVDVIYQSTAPYEAEHQRAIRWDDKDLAIEWPRALPVLSDRDANAGSFRDAEYFP